MNYCHSWLAVNGNMPSIQHWTLLCLPNTRQANFLTYFNFLYLTDKHFVVSRIWDESDKIAQICPNILALSNRDPTFAYDQLSLGNKFQLGLESNFFTING
jgi:hypothetical protein